MRGWRGGSCTTIGLRRALRTVVWKRSAEMSIRRLSEENQKKKFRIRMLTLTQIYTSTLLNKPMHRHAERSSTERLQFPIHSSFPPTRFLSPLLPTSPSPSTEIMTT